MAAATSDGQAGEANQASEAGQQETRQAAGPAVAAQIRHAILSGEFVPNQRLVEADLSAQFSASRASVRAALLELATEGLVERMQNRGARVRTVPLSEAIEISEVRMVVEGLCAAKAAERITKEEIAELTALAGRMRAAVTAGDVLGYSELNECLHGRIREISGQRTASEVLERLRARNVRHQFRLAVHPGRPSTSLPEHLAIISAVCAHDAEAAGEAARAHLSSVIRMLPEVAAERQSRQAVT